MLIFFPSRAVYFLNQQPSITLNMLDVMRHVIRLKITTLSKIIYLSNVDFVYFQYIINSLLKSILRAICMNNS